MNDEGITTSCNNMKINTVLSWDLQNKLSEYFDINEILNMIDIEAIPVDLQELTASSEYWIRKAKYHLKLDNLTFNKISQCNSPHRKFSKYKFVLNPAKISWYETILKEHGYRENLYHTDDFFNMMYREMDEVIVENIDYNFRTDKSLYGINLCFVLAVGHVSPIIEDLLQLDHLEKYFNYDIPLELQELFLRELIRRYEKSGPFINMPDDKMFTKWKLLKRLQIYRN
jgi:hypothetical protein